LDICDRKRSLEAYIVTRTHAEQHDVVVIVDEAGNHRAAAEVDRAGAGGEALRVNTSDADEAPALNRDLVNDGVPRVHRVDAPVDQPQVS
jgi:hypothetical protein